MQLPIRSCLFFPFGQASPVPLCRHYPCFPFFAFSTEGEKREKTYVSGESLLRCHQAISASRVRKASCFPLRAGFACSVVPPLPLLSPSGRVAQGAEIGQLKFRLFFQALSLLIFLAKKFAKLSAATRLPLACIKFSATTRLHLGGKLCRKAAVMRGSFNSDMPFAHRRPLLSLFTSSLPRPRNAIRKPFCPTFILA